MGRGYCPTTYLGFGRIYFNIAASDAQEPLSLFMECADGSFDMSDATRIPRSALARSEHGGCDPPDWCERSDLLSLAPGVRWAEDLAPSHSITSSARASSIGGISRPSALAVLS